MNNLVGIIVSIIYIVIVFGLSKFVAKKGEEISRKFVHILLCNIWFIYLIFIDSLIWACILPLAFVIINIFSYKFKLIKSMERQNNDGLGTIYYAFSILLISVFVYYIKMPIVGAPGILIMGYGDGLAAIVGQKMKSKKFVIGNSTKSFAGSFTMFCISLFISLVVFCFLGTEYLICKAVAISIIATILEAISIKGLDNITVPIGITILTYFLM